MRDVSSSAPTPTPFDPVNEVSSMAYARFPRQSQHRLAAAILSWLFYGSVDTGFLSGFRNSYRNSVVHNYIHWQHCDWCYAKWESTPYFEELTEDGRTSGGNPDTDALRMLREASGQDEADSSEDEPATE